MTTLKIKMTHIIRLLALSSLLLSTMSPTHANTVDLTGRTDKDVKRDITSKPLQIVEFVGIQKDDKVLDLLGGGGYYSVILKRVVGPEGAVVLHNNQAYIPYVKDQLAEKDTKGLLANIEQVISEVDDLKLGEQKFDVAFLIMGYHDFFYKNKNWDFDPDIAMPQLLQALKPGGKLLVIDHNAAKDHGAKNVEDLHRIEDFYVKTDLEKRGFKFIKQSDVLKNDHDDHSLGVFDPKIQSKTDRFVMLFEKPQ